MAKVWNWVPKNSFSFLLRSLNGRDGSQVPGKFFRLGPSGNLGPTLSFTVWAIKTVFPGDCLTIYFLTSLGAGQGLKFSRDPFFFWNMAPRGFGWELFSGLFRPFFPLTRFPVFFHSWCFPPVSRIFSPGKCGVLENFGPRGALHFVLNKRTLFGGLVYITPNPFV